MLRYVFVSIRLRYFRRLDRACCCKSGFGISVSISSILFRFRYASFCLEIEAHPDMLWSRTLAWTRRRAPDLVSACAARQRCHPDSGDEDSLCWSSFMQEDFPGRGCGAGGMSDVCGVPCKCLAMYQSICLSLSLYIYIYISYNYILLYFS